VCWVHFVCSIGNVSVQAIGERTKGFVTYVWEAHHISAAQGLGNILCWKNKQMNWRIHQRVVTSGQETRNGN